MLISQIKAEANAKNNANFDLFAQSIIKIEKSPLKSVDDFRNIPRTRFGNLKILDSTKMPEKTKGLDKNQS